MAKKQQRRQSKDAPKALRIGRIARVRKDGEEIRFKFRNGEKRKGKYAPAATLFARQTDRGYMISVAFESGFELDTDEEFYNLYLEDGVEVSVDESALESGGRGGRNRRRDEDADEEESADEDSDGDEEDEENPFE